MNAILRLALASAVLAALSAVAARSQTVDRDLQAKILYCKTCHGLSAEGYHGFYPIPRLAGQQPAYLENQLRAFIERRRTNPIMFNVAHVLSPEMLTGLGAYFKDQNPPPLGGAPKELVDSGKKIFQDGLPEANIPACSACHGPDAKGRDVFPRLAGQLHDYVINKLVNWTKERGQDPAHPDTSAIMEPIAHNLSQSQMAAVAAYLNYLE
jgi:cytochrome c553